MKRPVFALCFDVGGTLRLATPNKSVEQAVLIEIKELIQWQGSLESLEDTIKEREAQYRNWSRRTLIEYSEADLWTKFILPQHPAKWVAENAIMLNQLWRSRRIKKIFDNTVVVVQELYNRGYKLGIISNTTSSVEVPELLEEYHLKGFFSSVILSTSFGKRKPHPSLFISAARELQIPSENCAYIGNDPTRDLIGTRQAGFNQVILLDRKVGQNQDVEDEFSYHGRTLAVKPEAFISSLSQLLDIFPDISGEKVPEYHENPLYDVAFSTMWAVDQDMPFADTFQAGRDMGFTRFELNHKVTPARYQAYDHNQFYISTIHEPCPEDAGYDVLKSDDIAISSLDENKRIRSVDMVKHSIDLASQLGSRSVVIHPGAIVCDKSRDYQLRDFFLQGLKDTQTYQELLRETIADRQKYIQPHLEQVVRSMQELIGFTRGSDVALGLENRYRYYDIPLPDEMSLLLSLCDEEWYGFQYDTGHAFALDSLGLVEHSQWLERFSSRMIGIHLHDVKDGIIDHQVPGEGEFDFKWLAPYIPIQAQRTLEIGPQFDLSQIVQGLQFLAGQGCIDKISGRISE